MLLPIGEMNYDGRLVKFSKASHTNLSREGNGFVRDQFMNNDRYMMVFKEAMKQGLMSFGIYHPEMILITFTDTWGLHVSILLKRTGDHFVVKTMYNSKKNFFWKHFPKIHNRINLIHYFTLPAMTKEEYFASKNASKKLDTEIKAMNAVKKEAPLFLEEMKLTGVKKI